MLQSESIGDRPDPAFRSSSVVPYPEVGPIVARRPLGSVIIPAHNERRVIRRCLDALFTGLEPGELDITIVCNGCDDDTAALARSAGYDVRVFELEAASKSAALRAGDARATAFPRIYLDADVVLPGPAARAVLERLAAGSPAARPPLRYDTSRSSALVRSYFRARSRMPAVLGCLWGAGVYGLSSAGRARFDTFPDLGADDLWLDRQFDPAEIDIVDCIPVTVTAPRRSRDLLHTLRRTYRGKDETASTSRSDRRARLITARAVRDLLRLLRFGPQSGADAAVYAGFAVIGRIRAALIRITRGANPVVWERDDSSREVVA
jgi:glycosyltransferase involved in cell wall biosynthesis